MANYLFLSIISLLYYNVNSLCILKKYDQSYAPGPVENLNTTMNYNLNPTFNPLFYCSNYPNYPKDMGYCGAFVVFPERRKYFITVFKGVMNILRNATYVFDIGSDDGAQLVIGDQLVFSKWVSQSYEMNNATRYLTIGSYNYTLKMFQSLKEYIFYFKINPSQYVTVQNQIIQYLKYLPSIENAIFNDSKILQSYTPVIDTVDDIFLYYWYGQLIPPHDTDTVEYTVYFEAEFGKLVIDDIVLVDMEIYNPIKRINITTKISMNAGQLYKFELIYTDGFSIPRIMLGSSNQPPTLINSDSFSTIITYNGSLQTSLVNLTNGGLILNGDLEVKLLILNNSTLTITGSLKINEFLIIDVSYPPPDIKVSDCISGNGIIILNSVPVDPVIIQYNCDHIPVPLEIEYHFNVSSDNGCRKLNQEYSRTALVIAWVNTCSDVNLSNGPKTLTWDWILISIICAILLLAVVVMIIYFIVRRISYNKNMEQYEM